MDLDLKQKINIGEEKSKELCGIIKSDSLFLKSIGLIDYSLLIGIHEIRNQVSFLFLSKLFIFSLLFHS